MRKIQKPWLAGMTFVAGILAVIGCYHTPIDTSEYAQGPAPLRMASPAKEGCGCYQDSLTGGEIFNMYCNYCHNAPSLAERPFSNFQNVAAHMRVRANLTGQEYAKLVEFLRRWNDIPQPTPPIEPSPKKFIFSQPIQELRQATPAPAAEAAPKPQAQAPQPAPEASAQPTIQ